ncbi:PhoH [Spirochaeta lutea]|uniref:PhoH n=1 Tax=Spirochaeta lutea TaxID=1480694 RepID=A0A098QV38_9SPIO|nr:PhoH [Spirochaeta lutea]
MKSFVIDTNVLIHRPDAILSFKENEVVIPLWVLEELDRLKTFSDEKGRNARHAIRFLDSASRSGRLSEGVKLENGTILRVVMSHGDSMPRGFLEDKTDNKIILAAYELQQQGRQVFFVSKDINARVKATALGIKAVDYEKQKVNFSKLYAGYSHLDVSEDTLRTLEEEGFIPWNDNPTPNFYFVLSTKNQPNDTFLARYHADRGGLVYVDYKMPAVAGIRPLNDEQRIAFDLLMDDDIQLVSLVGKAGTGKTLLAMAAGLALTLERKNYTRVLVSRPVIPMGKDIGYLPGAKNEKLSHWMQPLFDNLEFILSVYHKQNIKSVDHLIQNRTIELEALSYIRGRSLPNQFIVIDEAQNLSPHEIKTIVSRAGEGSKVVLTGDPYQIDSPYLDANSNGLSYLAEAFKAQKIAGHVTLEKSERSALAELAAELL